VCCCATPPVQATTSPLVELQAAHQRRGSNTLYIPLSTVPGAKALAPPWQRTHQAAQCNSPAASTTIHFLFCAFAGTPKCTMHATQQAPTHVRNRQHAWGVCARVHAQDKSQALHLQHPVLCPSSSSWATELSEAHVWHHPRPHHLYTPSPCVDLGLWRPSRLYTGPIWWMQVAPPCPCRRRQPAGRRVVLSTGSSSAPRGSPGCSA
jgi:hypothetical protein